MSGINRVETKYLEEPLRLSPSKVVRTDLDSTFIFQQILIEIGRERQEWEKNFIKLNEVPSKMWDSIREFFWKKKYE